MQQCVLQSRRYSDAILLRRRRCFKVVRCARNDIVVGVVCDCFLWRQIREQRRSRLCHRRWRKNARNRRRCRCAMQTGRLYGATSERIGRRSSERLCNRSAIFVVLWQRIVVIGNTTPNHRNIWLNVFLHQWNEMQWNILYFENSQRICERTTDCILCKQQLASICVD